MALTDTFVKQVKHSGPTAGDKHTDGNGMYLLVKPAGKYWRMDYRFADKRKTLALGIYPAVSLAKARQRRDKARELLADGIDPGEAKKEAVQAKAAESANTFELVAREFHATQLEKWSPSHANKWMRMFERYLFPAIGDKPIASLTAPMILTPLKKVQDLGIIESAHSIKQSAGQVFRYGIQTGRCDRNPCADLTGALKPVIVKNFAAILDPVKVGQLMRDMDAYENQTTRVAMQLSALLFQRPDNIRSMEWAWLDLDKHILTIPPEKMKRTLHGKINGRPHLVPLAPQAVALLRTMQPLSGAGKYVFSSLLSGTRPMSENTVNAALRRMGYSKDDMTAHGFRAMAKTLILERLPGIDQGCVEAQLGHGKSGPLGSAYDRAEYMEQRYAMMRTWADYLDKLRIGADVIPIRSAA